VRCSPVLPVPVVAYGVPSCRAGAFVTDPASASAGCASYDPDHPHYSNNLYRIEERVPRK
jgi:hypothetical protein